MTEHEPMIAALRETDVGIPPVNPAPLLMHARHLARRRHRRAAMTTGTLALVVTGASVWLMPNGVGGVAAPVAAATSTFASAAPSPEGERIGSLTLASGLNVVVTASLVEAGLKEVWVKGALTGGEWTRMDGFGPLDAVRLDAHSGLLTGRLDFRTSSVDLRWGGASHHATSFQAKDGMTYFAIDASLPMSGGLPREPVTAIAVDSATHASRSVELPSGVAQAKEHPLAAGDEAVVVRPSVDQPGLEDVLWIARDGRFCFGDRDTSGVLATGGCNEGPMGEGSAATVRDGAPVNWTYWVVVPGSTARARAYNHAGNELPMTVHRFKAGTVAVGHIVDTGDVTKMQALDAHGTVLKTFKGFERPPAQVD